MEGIYARLKKSTFERIERINSMLSDPKTLRKVTKKSIILQTFTRGQIAGAFGADILHRAIYSQIPKKASDLAVIRRDSAEIGRQIGGGVVYIFKKNAKWVHTSDFDDILLLSRDQLHEPLLSLKF